MTDEELDVRLKSLGVHFARETEPDLIERSEFPWLFDGKPGNLRLSICVSYSHDPGYSMYEVGYGDTIEECVANLKDDYYG